MYFVYIIRTKNNHLYIGHTNNLKRREFDHWARVEGAKYIKDSGTAFNIVYSEIFPTRVEATRRERQLKGWTRTKKEALIRDDLAGLKNL